MLRRLRQRINISCLSVRFIVISSFTVFCRFPRLSFGQCAHRTTQSEPWSDDRQTDICATAINWINPRMWCNTRARGTKRNAVMLLVHRRNETVVGATHFCSISESIVANRHFVTFRIQRRIRMFQCFLLFLFNPIKMILLALRENSRQWLLWHGNSANHRIFPHTKSIRIWTEMNASTCIHSHKHPLDARKHLFFFQFLIHI